MTAEPTPPATADVAEVETYDISSYQLHRAQARVEQLQRRARKLHRSDALGLEVVRTYDRSIYSDITGEVIRKITRYEVKIAGEAPALAGYTFLATIEHLEEGNVVRQVPGVLAEGALNQWREGQPLCEHCKTNRVRKDTFLLRQDSTGRIFQVGRNCLVDFVGADADLVGRLAELLGLLRDFMRAMGGEDDDLGPRGRREEDLIPLEYYLSYVAAAIRTGGWVSKTAARERSDLMATATVAHLYMEQDEKCAKGPLCPIRGHSHVERTEKDYAEAQLAIAYIEGLAEVENKSDYIHNLWVACASLAVSRRHLGIAASAIIARRNEEARRVEREEKAKARAERDALFVDAYLPGEVGERLRGVEVTLLDTRELESQYGVTVLHKFMAKGGYRVAWFSSSETSFEVGQTYTVDCTIKRLDDKHGKQAVVTRVALSKKRKAK